MSTYKKFTFKKCESKWPYSTSERTSSHIKIQGKIVGHISELRESPSGSERYKVSFAIHSEKTKENPSGVKWVSLKKRFSGDKEAREWLNTRYRLWLHKIELYGIIQERRKIMVNIDIMDTFLRRKRIGSLPIRETCKREPRKNALTEDPRWSVVTELSKKGKFLEANNMVQSIYRAHGGFWYK